MKAIITETTNGKFSKEGCYDLPVTLHKLDGSQCAEACFELSKEELEQVKNSNKIYFTFFGGAIPPMMVHTESYVEEVNNGKVESKSL